MWVLCYLDGGKMQKIPLRAQKSYTIGRHNGLKQPSRFIALNNYISVSKRLKIHVGHQSKSNPLLHTSLTIEALLAGRIEINGKPQNLHRGQNVLLDHHKKAVSVHIHDFPGITITFKWYLLRVCLLGRHSSKIRQVLQYVDACIVDSIDKASHVVFDDHPDPENVLLAISRQCFIFGSTKWATSISSYLDVVDYWYYPREGLLPEFADATYIPNKQRRGVFRGLMFFTFDDDNYSKTIKNMGANVWNVKTKKMKVNESFDSNDLEKVLDQEANINNKVSNSQEDLSMTTMAKKETVSQKPDQVHSTVENGMDVKSEVSLDTDTTKTTIKKEIEMNVHFRKGPSCEPNSHTVPHIIQEQIKDSIPPHLSQQIVLSKNAFLEMHIMAAIESKIALIESVYFLQSSQSEIDPIIQNIARCYGTLPVSRRQIAMCLMYINRNGLATKEADAML